MDTSKTNRHRIISLTFSLLALGLMLLAMLWPAAAADLLRSRLAVALLAAWSAGISILFNRELCAGFAQGIREFREACRSIGGDDDDPPAAA